MEMRADLAKGFLKGSAKLQHQVDHRPPGGRARPPQSLQLLLQRDDALADVLLDNWQLPADGPNQVTAQLCGQEAHAHVAQLRVGSGTLEKLQLLPPCNVHAHLHAETESVSLERQLRRKGVEIFRAHSAKQFGSSALFGFEVPCPGVDVGLASIDDTDPAMLQSHSTAFKDLSCVCTRVHDIQLSQHTCRDLRMHVLRSSSVKLAVNDRDR